MTGEDDPWPDEPDPIDLDEPDGEAEFWKGLREHATHATRPTPNQSAIDERAEMRRVALTVPCRDCKVPVDAVCVNEFGQPLRKFPAHTTRQNDARKAQR